MVVHCLKTVRNADQIGVVEKGRMVQQGKYNELMQQNGIYKRFVNARKTVNRLESGRENFSPCRFFCTFFRTNPLK